MNFDDMSDFEINKKLVGLVNNCSDWTYNEKDRCYVKFERDGKLSIINTHYITNYCNSWADMGPLIVEHQITIAKCDGLNFWEAYAGGYGVNYDHLIYSDIDCSHEDKNPLRAAAICLIKKLEA